MKNLATGLDMIHPEVPAERSSNSYLLFLDLIYIIVIFHLTSFLSNNFTLNSFWHYLVIFLLIYTVWIGQTVFESMIKINHNWLRINTIILSIGLLGMSASFAWISSDISQLVFVSFFTVTRLSLLNNWCIAAKDSLGLNRLFKDNAKRFFIETIILLVAIVLPYTFLWWAGVAAASLLRPLKNINNIGPRILPSLDKTLYVERFGLFVAIVLGEILLSTSIEVADLKNYAYGILIISITALTISLIWWFYYEDALKAYTSNDSITRIKWEYWHLPMFVGANLIAVGVKLSFMPLNYVNFIDSKAGLILGYALVFYSLAKFENLFLHPDRINYKTSVIIFASRMFSALIIAGLYYVSPIVSMVFILLIILFISIGQLLFETIFIKKRDLSTSKFFKLVSSVISYSIGKKQHA